MPDGFMRRVGVEAARDGAIDDGRLLLAQERDEPLLGRDEAVYLGELAVEEGDDGILLGAGRDNDN